MSSVLNGLIAKAQRGGLSEKDVSLKKLWLKIGLPVFAQVERRLQDTILSDAGTVKQILEEALDEINEELVKGGWEGPLCKVSLGTRSIQETPLS